VIFAYSENVCIRTGELPKLHVDANADHVPLRYFRWGAQIEQCVNTRRSGVYVAVFGDGVTPRQLDARSGRALFVVRDPDSPAKLLVVLPLFTYHAYNVAEVDGTLGKDEGQCLYSGAAWVSLHRPGGGAGGHPWDEVNADAYDRASPRQTFAHWDAKGIAWLERRGYDYDCCTDLELHDPQFDLSRYRAIVSFGHHEYWTDSMRKRIERYLASGGNVAFFGGNTCWFRAEYDASLHRVRRVGRWTEYPEWRTTGVSYAFGGGKWIGERPPSGYRVVNASHWIFRGTGTRAGDVFGARERLIGYECDGAPDESDLDVAAEASIRDWPVRDGSGEVSERARANLGVRQAGGLVFTASTVDWARVLSEGEPIVERVTRNVLDRFLG
jgi:hypothetical protein